MSRMVREGFFLDLVFAVIIAGVCWLSLR